MRIRLEYIGITVVVDENGLMVMLMLQLLIQILKMLSRKVEGLDPMKP